MPTADELLGAGEVEALVANLGRVAPTRSWAELALVVDAFPELGLRQRVSAVRQALLACLPADFDDAAAIFWSALADPHFSGWRIWPVSEAVAALAVGSGRAADLDGGLALTAALTPRLTSEFALRPFLNADLDRTLAAAISWSRSPDEHLRRLASEGTRPLLPWALQVPALRREPALTIDVLDALHLDVSELVRRSVANHLNDISRIDAAFAVSTAERWLADGPDENTARLVKHALRTLVKQGDPRALALAGFGSADDLEVAGPLLSSAIVAVGGSLSFEAVITNRSSSAVKVAVDYVIHFHKASGKLAPKVFKLATPTLGPGASVSFARVHSFRPITTRRYYPGPHALELQVNGRRHGQVGFELSEVG